MGAHVRPPSSPQDLRREDSGGKVTHAGSPLFSKKPWRGSIPTTRCIRSSDEMTVLGKEWEGRRRQLFLRQNLLLDIFWAKDNKTELMSLRTFYKEI